MSVGEAAAGGVVLAQQALRHLADDRESEALELLNAASEAEAKWAAAYLLSAVRESVSARYKRPAQVRWAIHRAANDLGDVLLSQADASLQRPASPASAAPTTESLTIHPAHTGPRSERKRLVRASSSLNYLGGMHG